MATGTLPRPAPLTTDTDASLSILRAIQLITSVEDSFEALHSRGVLSGGAVSVVSGFSVQVAAGTVLWAEGEVLTLAAAQTYSLASVAAAQVYLYGKVLVTHAAKTAPTTADTYALDLTHNTTGVTPAGYFPLASWATSSAGVSGAIDNQPAGKYVRFIQNPGRRAITLSGNLTLTAAQYADRSLDFDGVGGTLTFPAEAGREWRIYNGTSGDLLCTTASGTGTTVPAGKRLTVYCNGANIVPGEESVAGFDSDLTALSGRVDALEGLCRWLLWKRFETWGDVPPDDFADQFALALGAGA